MSLQQAEQRLREFHNAFGAEAPEFPDLGNARLQDLRIDLIQEELNELQDAFNNNDQVEALDALCDLAVVVIGAAVAFGLPISEGFDEVMDSNMSKLGLDGKPIKREDGKILKGPNYRPPDLAKVLQDHIKTLRDTKMMEHNNE